MISYLIKDHFKQRDEIIWEYVYFFNSDMLWSVKSIRDSTSYISSFLIVIGLSFKI